MRLEFPLQLLSVEIRTTDTLELVTAKGRNNRCSRWRAACRRHLTVPSGQASSSAISASLSSR